MPIVIPGPALNTREAHVLDGVELADGIIFDLVDAPVFTPAPSRLDWIGGVDSDGSVPLDEGHSDNSTLALPLRVQTQSSADNAWNKIGVILDKLQAVRRSRDGLPHIWTPKDMTDSWQLTVRAGEITELPMASRGDTIGYLLRAPRFTLMLTCDPFMYRVGELVEYDEVTSTEPVFSILLEDVPGHADAEATITVTDDAGQARRHVEWGLAENSTAPLLIDSSDLDITVGEFAAAATTRTGAYSSNGVVRATLATQAQAVCGTGALENVGVLRPKARIWASSLDIRLRLAYRTADNPYSYTPWIAPIVEDDFCELAFGVITISEVQAGAQEWDGRIEAYSATTGDTLDVDYFEPLPADRWGKARASYQRQAGLIRALDAFTGATAGGNLNGRALPVGSGNWATSGSTGDFQFADGPDTGDETIVRTAQAIGAAARVATMGTTVFSDVEFSWDFRHDVVLSAADCASYVRYVDSNNYLGASISPGPGGPFQARMEVFAKVAGVFPYNPGAVDIGGIQPDLWYRVRLIVLASGRGWWSLFERDSGILVYEVSFAHSSLATGGALDDGICAFRDTNSSGNACTRYYDGFYAATPPAEPIAVYADRAIEIRHDSCERESGDGLTRGKPKSYTGGRPYAPASGDEGRETRLWAKARRGDIDVAADPYIADPTKLRVALRPRYRLPAAP